MIAAPEVSVTSAVPALIPPRVRLPAVASYRMLPLLVAAAVAPSVMVITLSA